MLLQIHVESWTSPFHELFDHLTPDQWSFPHGVRALGQHSFNAINALLTAMHRGGMRVLIKSATAKYGMPNVSGFLHLLIIAVPLAASLTQQARACLAFISSQSANQCHRCISAQPQAV